jgi:FkbM family methyltransferase
VSVNNHEKMARPILSTLIRVHQMSLIPSLRGGPNWLYVKRALKIAFYNLRTRDPRRRISVVRSGDFFVLSTGEKRIAIVSIGRWSRYRHGIDAQLRRLADRYGALALAKDLEGGVVIDVGANIGEFALYCDALGARVIAIEADPRNFEALKWNAKGTGVAPINVALWKCETQLTFFSSPARADSSLIEPEDVEDSFKIRARTLDQIVLEAGANDVALLKIDAEGAEPEVLQGGTEALRRTRYVSVDCGPERRGERTVSECRAILERQGFTVRMAHAGSDVILGERLQDQRRTGDGR